MGYLFVAGNIGLSLVTIKLQAPENAT